MRLVFVARVALMFCGGLLLLVALLMVLSFRQIEREREEMAWLLRLQTAVGGLSAPATSLVFTRAAPGIRDLFVADVETVIAELERLGERHADASKAAAHLQSMLRATVPEAVAADAAPGSMAQLRADMAQVTTSAIAAQGALQDATAEARRDIEQRSRRIDGLLVIVSSLFGALSLLAFWLIHQRIGTRISHLAKQVHLVRGGGQARAHLSGDDELTELALAFNDLVEGQEQALKQLEDRRADVLHSEEMLRESQRVARIGGFRYYPQERRLEWSDEAFRVFGIAAQPRPPSLKSFLDRVHPDDRRKVTLARERAAESLTPSNIRYRILRNGQPVKHVQERALPSFDSAGGLDHWYGTLQDVTETENLLDELLEKNRELAEQTAYRKLLIDCMPANIAMLDASGTIIEVNDQWRRFGTEAGSATGGDSRGMNYLEVCEAASGEHSEEAGAVADGMREIIAGTRSELSIEYPCHSPSERRWYRLMARPLRSEGRGASLSGVVMMHVDVTERMLAQERLRRQAFYDELTGLLSRPGLLQAVEHRLEQHAGGIMVMFDLINFHDVNDSFGVSAGDHVLREIAARIQAMTPAAAEAGRIGADEFVVFFPPAVTEEAAREALATVFRHPLTLSGGQQVYSTAAFGASGTAATGNQEATGFLQRAELALFRSRSRGRAWTTFSEMLLEGVRERIQLTSDLYQALDREELHLYFQPKVDLRNGELIACEALLRWQHPERGLLSPGVFIPAAEQSQLILPIGRWVLREACRQLVTWNSEGLDVVAVSVNVSLVQLRNPGFVTDVAAILEETGVAPRHLTLEITETAFSEETSLLREKLERLRDLGLRLSLDDFGTGYSSLQYLKSFPFQEVKVDQSFVIDLIDDRYSRSIVQTVLALADAIGATALAEGIETDAVAKALVELGCFSGQGYYYSLPLEVEDFRWLLGQQRQLPLASA